VTIEDLGRAPPCPSSDKDNTTIVEGKGKIIRYLKPESNRSKRKLRKPPSDFDREKLQERMAKLSGGVAVIKVGAATEVELKSRQNTAWKMLFSATRAAVEEGILPGGGRRPVEFPAPPLTRSDDRRRRNRGGYHPQKPLKNPSAGIANQCRQRWFLVIVDAVKKSKKGVGYDAEKRRIRKHD